MFVINFGKLILLYPVGDVRTVIFLEGRATRKVNSGGGAVIYHIAAQNEIAAIKKRQTLIREWPFALEQIHRIFYKALTSNAA